jgi:hypothetical protein
VLCHEFETLDRAREVSCPKRLVAPVSDSLGGRGPNDPPLWGEEVSFALRQTAKDGRMQVFPRRAPRRSLVESGLAGKRDQVRRLLTRNLYPFRTRGRSRVCSIQATLQPVLQGFYLEPSDGFEPSTPSLPSRALPSVARGCGSAYLTCFLS